MTYTFFSFLIIVIIYITFKPYFKKYIKDVVKHTSLNNKPLPDIGHILFPDLSEYHYVGDIFVLIIFLITIIYFILYEKLNTHYIMNICNILMYCIVIKMLLTAITILPDPSGICEIKSKYNIGHCNDLLPSGHMLFVFVIYFVLYPRLSNVMNGLYILQILLLWFITIASRNHYTIDTIVSFFIAYTVVSLLRKE